MRRPLAWLLVLAAVIAGCQSPPRIERILESRELRVGLTGTQPPLNVKTRTGATIGLEVDLVDALADSMGLEVVFVQMPFAELLPALERREVDMVISGMTITPDRNARVAFVGPYFVSGKSLLTRNKELAKSRKAAALDRPDITYAALEGSTSAGFVQVAAPRSKLVTTPDYDSGVQMLLADEVDALVADFPICEVSILRYPDAGLVTLTTPLTLEPLGIALPADDPLLVNLVENYLKTLEQTGKLTQLQARWFSYGDWVQELP